MMTAPQQPFLIDSHTHLDHYAPAEVPSLLERARSAGVRLVVAAGVTVDSSRACVALAEAHDLVYAGVGIHPMDLKAPVDDATYGALLELAHHPRTVVVSEIGLDYLPGAPERGMQHQAFRRQIALAREVGLPIVFHSREAHADTLRLLREEHAEDVGAVMHYFQGDEATAREAIASGFLISLARPLLRLPHLQEVAARLPLGHIVLETDAAPQPWKKHRRNWTEPYHVRLVAEKLAELQGVSLEEVARVTSANLLRLLRRRVPTPAWVEGVTGEESAGPPP